MATVGSRCGLVRGLGAMFGLLATSAFPYVVKRPSLMAVSRVFIVWEAVFLILAGVAFASGRDAVWFFGVFLLLSRIGLYGFSLGEAEIRQISVPTEVKGRVNGFAQAVTGLSTICVYAAGTYVGDQYGFAVLVYGSIGFVCLAAAVFSASSQTATARIIFNDPLT